jgi:hypothetical protein
METKLFAQLLLSSKTSHLCPFFNKSFVIIKFYDLRIKEGWGSNPHSNEDGYISTEYPLHFEYGTI